MSDELYKRRNEFEEITGLSYEEAAETFQAIKRAFIELGKALYATFKKVVEWLERVNADADSHEEWRIPQNTTKPHQVSCRKPKYVTIRNRL